MSLPSLEPVLLLDSWGLWPALTANLAIFGAIAYVATRMERRSHGRIVSFASRTERSASFWRGPWALLWGAKGLAALGVDVASWGYGSVRLDSLESPVFEDVTSIMNFGIVVGALAAPSLAGKFAPVWRIPLRSLVAAVVGGSCWDTARAWRLAAISVRISAASCRVACTPGCGCPQPLPGVPWAYACVPYSAWRSKKPLAAQAVKHSNLFVFIGSTSMNHLIKKVTVVSALAMSCTTVFAAETLNAKVVAVDGDKVAPQVEAQCPAG